MPTAESLRMIDLANLEWPVSYRFHTESQWGRTQQVLTVDAPHLNGEPEKSAVLGQLLWKRGIAPAITDDTRLWYWETVCWKQLPIPVPKPDGVSSGRLHGAPAPRADSGVILMGTGHDDGDAWRRVFLPGIPRDWVVGHMLTDGGMSACEWWGHRMMLGLARELTASPCLWLIAYPGAVDWAVGNPSGVAFRRVEYLRCCRHTERAPDPSTEPWP